MSFVDDDDFNVKMASYVANLEFYYRKHCSMSSQNQQTPSLDVPQVFFQHVRVQLMSYSPCTSSFPSMNNGDTTTSPPHKNVDLKHASQDHVIQLLLSNTETQQTHHATSPEHATETQFMTWLYTVLERFYTDNEIWYIAHQNDYRPSTINTIVSSEPQNTRQSCGVSDRFYTLCDAPSTLHDNVANNKNSGQEQQEHNQRQNLMTMSHQSSDEDDMFGHSGFDIERE